jgi:hypothetical protein
MGFLSYMLQQNDQEAARQRYGALLNEYRTAGDPNTPNPGPWAAGQPEMTAAQQQLRGGFQAPGGPLSDQPPPEFFLRAAGIQGYEQLAQNAQSQAAAMQRQQQQQGWESTNMTLAQKVAADAQAQRDKFQQERHVYEYDNPSAYQNAQLGIQRGQLGISQQNADLNRMQFQAQFMPDPNVPGGYMPRPKPVEPLNFAQQQEVLGAQNTYTAAKNALGDLSTIYQAGAGTNMPAWSSGQRKAMQDQYQGALRPIVQAIVMGNRTDAPGEADIKQINEFLGDVTSPWQTSATQQNRIKMLESWIDQKYKPYERFTGPLMYQPGQSPYAQTFGLPAVPASKVGPLKPFNPPGAK